MAEYMSNINSDDYRERQRVYVTEITGSIKTFVPLKLSLNSSNFNFVTAKSDGSDFRLAETQAGINVLQMWTAHWDSVGQKATLWFKLPHLAASETKTLWAFWGNSDAASISNLKYLLGENPQQDLSYTADLTTATGTITGSAGTVNPERAFDDQLGNLYCDIPKNGWVQYSFSTAQRITKVRVIGHNSGNNTNGVTVRASNDNFVSQNVFLFAQTGETISWQNWHAYVFYNDTAYTDYRIYHSGTGATWRLLEAELMANDQTEITSTPVFSFGDDFTDSELDANKWTNSIGYGNVISNSRINLAEDGFIELVSNHRPLENVRSWIVEEGLYGVGSPSSTTNQAHRYNFYGGDNEIQINYYWEGNTDRQHNFVDSGSVATDAGTERGLEVGSYSENYLIYRESTDRVYQGMAKRDTYADYDDNWERQVHRNTELEYFRIFAESNANAEGVDLDWVIVRNYTPDTDPTIDISELSIPYETIGHQVLDTTAYASDITSVDFYHASDMGGDPYRLADNITNSISNVFISDTTTSGSLIIDFGRESTNLVSNTYLHFDSGHTTYYNASKLSDLDADIFSRSYWQSTTASGSWAAIQFPSAVMVGCLAVTAVSSNLNGMIKDFRFYGTNYDPRFATVAQKDLLTSGVFSRIATEQTVYFTTSKRTYRYYILEALSTYGSNVALQEWGMYELTDDVGKKVISQLRLHPVDIVSQEYYFPKKVAFYGSNNMTDWTEIVGLTETYTPFFDATYGRWQRFSLTNSTAYYAYKVVCVDNWYAQDDKIKIAEWEMVEKVSEADNFRILEGASANFNNIWADSTATFESGNVYITNDQLNVILDNTLIESTTPADTVDDMNVK